MSESKCRVNGNKIEPCAALAKSLERDAEYTMRKGLLIYKIWNESLTRGPDFVMLRSVNFLNYQFGFHFVRSVVKV